MSFIYRYMISYTSGFFE